MIQDVWPETLDMTFKRPSPADGDLVVPLKGNKALLADAPDGPRLLTHGQFKAAYPERSDGLAYLFSISGIGFYHCDDAPDGCEGHGLHDVGLFREYRPGWQAFGGITACHLGLWYAANRFCGACAAPMRHKEDERALICPRCMAPIYPRISPAVIVGVLDGGRILLTRYANRPNSRLTALIAGFVEVGETLEDAVRREVMEEVGVRVKNIRYYKSQPWAFSGSLLTGFYADLDGSPEITLDAAELQEARWFERGELSPNDNPPSLTATMVEAFRVGGPG